MADIRELAQELVALTSEEVKQMREQMHAWRDLDAPSIMSNPFYRIGVHKCRSKSEAQRKKEIAKRRKKNKSKKR